MPKSNQRTLLLLIGMHRSGTSMCASIISELGITLAQNAKSSIGEDNQKGYFEDLDLARQQDDFLKQLNSHWGNTNPLILDTKSTSSRDAIEYIGNYLSKEFLNTDTLCIKDPRVCRLLPLWLIAAQNMAVNVKTITLIREPEQVSASLHRRDGMPVIQGKLLWTQYYIEAINSIDANQNTTIFFEEIVSDALSVKSSLDKLGINHNNSTLSNVVTPELINHKHVTNKDHFIHQLVKNRDNQTAMLSILNEWHQKLAKLITLADYNELVNYTYSTLNDASDHARKIRNLEWSLENRTSDSTLKKLIKRLFR